MNVRRRRSSEDFLAGMDRELRAVYERIHARELACREEVFKQYPAFLVNGIPARNSGVVRTTVVRRWLRQGQVFAFLHRGHYFFPAF